MLEGILQNIDGYTFHIDNQGNFSMGPTGGTQATAQLDTEALGRMLSFMRMPAVAVHLDALFPGLIEIPGRSDQEAAEDESDAAPPAPVPLSEEELAQVSQEIFRQFDEQDNRRKTGALPPLPGID